MNEWCILRIDMQGRRRETDAAAQEMTAMLKLAELCPPVDALTLLQMRSDACLAIEEAPPSQKPYWAAQVRRIEELLALAAKGAVPLNIG